ncbi:serine/threonine-protein kinase [Streptomyces sp. NPDC008313]|uniref:serine/threonine-protein kinase n=1 Tax=Streptomyces sp. NPDC008313 TaxID=3364826 RepID=UPI0036E20B96
MQGLLLAGRYRLVDAIGSGGMGRVWRAHDEVLHRAVAVKELTAALYVTDSDRAVLLARTHAEARAAARINHSAVVTVHDVLEHDNRPWIVMELVEGGSLADAVKDRGRMEPAEAARIGLWVLRALRAAHTAGVLHRDVKPGNVLLSDDGRVLLTDFGIAQVEGDTTITRTGEIVGSVDYLAPERVRGHDPGPASDLWALGATLYTAVEGKSPFRRTSPLTTMQAVVDEEPESARYAGPLEPVITALLHKDPAGRPGMGEAEQMLAEAAEGRRPSTAQAYVPTQHVPSHHGRVPQGATPHGAGHRGTGPYMATPHDPTTAAGTHADTHAGAHGGTHGGTSGGTHGGTQGSAYGAPYGGAPASQGTPGSTLHGPLTAHTAPTYATHTPAPAPVKRGRARTIVVVAVLAALVGGGGAVLTQYLDGRRGDSHASTGTEADEAEGGAAGESSQGMDGLQTSGAVPDGWVRVKDAQGFSLALPKGWKRQAGGTQVDYTPDDGEHFVRIAIDDSPDFDSAYAHQQDLEQQLERLHEYRRISLAPNTFRDRPGALWDFTWTALAKDSKHPGPRRAIEETYVGRDGVEYAIYMSSPAADWDKTRQQFGAVLRSWRPGSG